MKRLKQEMCNNKKCKNKNNPLSAWETFYLDDLPYCEKCFDNKWKKEKRESLFN